MKYHISQEALQKDAVKTLWDRGYHPREIAIALDKPIEFVYAIVE